MQHTNTWTHTHTHFTPPPNIHLWSHKVHYAPEGACGKEIHYFSFCLPLLFVAQQLKRSDQPTITIHNGFSASSTSLEACLRSGLSPWGHPLLPRPPWLQPLPSVVSVSMCAHAGRYERTVFVCMGIQSRGCDYDNGRPHWHWRKSARAPGGPWHCLITQELGGGREVVQSWVRGKIFTKVSFCVCQ